MGEQIPSSFKSEQWSALFSCPSFRQILQTFRHFSRKRRLKLHELIEKRSNSKQKKMHHEGEIKKRQEEKHIVYGLGHNNIFIRFHRSKMEGFENSRVIWNFHDWGQPMVIDLVIMRIIKTELLN